MSAPRAAAATTCATCDAAALPGMPTTCTHDDDLTLFEYVAPTLRIIHPTAPTETAAQLRDRLARHHAETVAFFDGFTL